MLFSSNSFGLVIGKLRIQESLSQKELANRAGIARSHLVALENGKKIARLDTLWRIAEALNVKPSTLIMLIEEESEEDCYKQSEKE